ncbi:SAMHD1 [Bugula neritina]|uniref:SAMHD1 n=1 Tax=Bugula neritina TaxID=10212 RepID=A0A7J7J6D3_BUGNE|nr:SAMHD1 [Bugula neritina]
MLLLLQFFPSDILAHIIPPCSSSPTSLLSMTLSIYFNDLTSLVAVSICVKHSFDYERILHYARVITAEGRPHICVRDKMVDTIYQLYSTRYNLHKHAYQHPVALGVALMVEDAIVMASDSLKICGKSIVKCLNDMEAYTNLHDGIFYLIRDSNDWRLEEARQLLKRIEERKLYQRVAHATYKKDECQPSTADLEEELESCIPGRKFKLVFRQRDFGKKIENPVKFIKFYAKRELNRVQPWKDNSLLFPNDFMDETVSAYCISGVVNSEVFDEAERIFREHGLKVSNLHD